MIPKWTLLFVFCVLPVFGEQNPRMKAVFSKLKKERENAFKQKLFTMAEERNSKQALKGGKRLAPIVSIRQLFINECTKVTTGCTAQMGNSDVIFVATAENNLSMLINDTLVSVNSFRPYSYFLSLQALQYRNSVLLVSQERSKNERSYVNVYEIETSILRESQRMNVSRGDLVSAIKFTDEFYIVIIMKNLHSHELRLYKGTEAEEIEEIYSTSIETGCTGLTIWTSERNIYIALSYASTGRLEIKRYLENSWSMSHVQSLNVSAYILKTFEDDSSRYLVCGTKNSIIIFWWTGSSFEVWQSMHLKRQINDIVIKFFIKPLIAVVFQYEVEFLIKDHSAQFVIAGRQSFGPSKSLKSILLAKKGANLYMLPQCNEEHFISMYEIRLEFQLLDAGSRPQFDCMKVLNDRINKKGEMLNNIATRVENVWSSVKPYLIESLEVKGAISSLTNSTVFWLNSTRGIPSPINIEETISALRNIAATREGELSKLVRKHDDEFITSDLHFASITARHAEIGKLLKHVKINELSTSHLPRVLRKKGSQVFTRNTILTNARCKTATTRFLNRNRIEDFVLLNRGSCIFTGNATYNSISARNVYGLNTINGINMEDIVLKSKAKNIWGQKTFKNLAAKSITSKKINQIPFSETEGIVYKNRIRFTSPLSIKGNFNVSLLNSKHLYRLYNSTVKKNEPGNIDVSKILKSVKILRNAEIYGTLNGASVRNLMTVNTDQIINGPVTFSSAKFDEDVLTDSLNGIHLASDAVTKSNFNLGVNGVKTFIEDLNVSHIVTKNGTLIDYVDPSVDFDQIFGLINDTGRSTRYFFKNPIIFGNVEAENVIVQTNVPYLSELNNVWLKSTEQNITRSEAKLITVKEINVSKVNGINLEDFVKVNEEDFIDATVEFTEKVSTGTLKGADFNFPPEFWNPDVQVQVSGSIFMKNATLKGNLNIMEPLKDLEFMCKEASQTVEDDFSFSTIHLKNLTLTKLKSELVNNKNITEYFKRAVLSSEDMYVYNKNFTSLKGRAMECEGTLNNVEINKVVTTNTKQTLESSYNFTNSVYIENSAGVETFFGGIRLKDVIGTDVTEKISNKYFKGTVKTCHLNANGNVSGVDVTLLSSEAFNKSSDHVLPEKITFRGNINASEIFVVRNKTVDNVYLENLIRLDGYEKFEYLNASSITIKNINVHGDVNRCKLESVFDNALRMKEGNQKITSRVHLTDLIITGSLNIEYCNGAPIPSWIEIFNRNSRPVEDRNAVFEKMDMHDVHISGTVNGIDVDFLLNDYVHKNNRQVVRGKKFFRNIRVKNIITESLISNRTCGINLSTMYNSSIYKSENKISFLRNPTLPGLNAKRIMVKGSINSASGGLKLPEDVYLSTSNETIADHVTFGNFSALEGLNVYGEIDGVHLESFIDERVSLSKNQTILSEMIFENDVFIEGNCSIRKINNTRLDEIVNGVKNQTITGTKIFNGNDLSVIYNVVVNGPINLIHFDQLQKNLVRKSENENLKGMVTFTSISAPSLECSSINGINIVDIYNYTHPFHDSLDDKLFDFTAKFISHKNELNRMDSVDNTLLLYKSFELHKILDFGLIEKFLPVYAYGSYGPKYELEVVQMVMWKKEDDGQTKSIIADVMKDGTFKVMTEMSGKVFPFILNVQQDVVGFYVQETGTTGCSSRECITVMVLYNSGERKKTGIPSNGSILDIQLLEVEKIIFLILAFSNAGPYERIFVYQYDEVNSDWQFYQKFHVQNVTSLNIIDETNCGETDPPSIYLAVTGDENPGVTVYEFTADFDEFQFDFKTNISTTVSTHATWVCGDHDIYLLLAKEMGRIYKENNVSVKILNQPLDVYTMVQDDLSLNHTVNVKGVSSLEAFGFAEETFVLATSKHFGTIYVLQFGGYNGFNLIQEIPSPGTTETRVYTVNNDLYLAANSRKRPKIDENTTYARILKSSVKRQRHEFDIRREKITPKLFV